LSNDPVEVPDSLLIVAKSPERIYESHASSCPKAKVGRENREGDRRENERSRIS
jgi:hypothetical protein